MDATVGPDAQGCAGHTHLSDELRAVVELLAHRMQPWLERLAQPVAGAASCSWCPVCALVAALRGDRSEIVGRLADHAAGMLAAARELLTPPVQPTADTDRATSGRIGVQHIDVRPVTRDAGGAPRC